MEIDKINIMEYNIELINEKNYIPDFGWLYNNKTFDLGSKKFKVSLNNHIVIANEIKSKNSSRYPFVNRETNPEKLRFYDYGLPITLKNFLIKKKKKKIF